MKSLAKLKPKLPKTVTELFRQITAVSSQTLGQPQNLIPSLARIAQRIVSAGLTEGISQEWNYLVKKGVIKDEFSPKMNYCILELLNFLENEMPDEERFQVMKKILLVAASESEEEREKHTPHTYMKIIKQLSSEEILIMNSIYNVFKNKKNKIDDLKNTNNGRNSVFLDEWFNLMVSESGLKHKELVAIQEQKLIDKQLISSRVSRGEMIRIDENFRLTSLGLGIWDYIGKYNKLYQPK